MWKTWKKNQKARNMERKKNQTGSYVEIEKGKWNGAGFNYLTPPCWNWLLLLGGENGMRILQMRSSKLWRGIQSQTQKFWRGRLRGEECENSLVRGAGKNSFLQGWCPLGNKNLPPGGHPTSCTRKMWLQGQQWESERPWLDPQRGKRIVLEPQRQSSSGCISNALSIQKGLE